jgi:hypothetical protein
MNLWRNMGLPPMLLRCGREILPDIQTNARRKRFLGTKRCGKAECSDHPAAIMAIQAKNGAFRVALHHGGRPSPHQETEAWPQLRTRTSVFLYLRKHGFREILPPDALQSWSQAVVRSAEGEVISLPCCLLRTLCDCQMSGFPVRLFPALVDLLVMNSVFNVNEFFG